MMKIWKYPRKPASRSALPVADMILLPDHLVDEIIDCLEDYAEAETEDLSMLRRADIRRIVKSLQGFQGCSRK